MKKKASRLIVFFICVLFPVGISSELLAQEFTSRPDGHAPIGVMGDHMHEAGETMLSYRYMYMNMDGNRDGTDRLSSPEVLANYPVSPTDMDMEMHMLGLMFAPRDWVTLMFSLPIVNVSMNHVTGMGGRFSTNANGLGDVKASALWGLYETECVESESTSGHFFHLNTGVSLPTGEIDERDNTPLMAEAPLPYPMQLGSGTVDLLPGITYRGYFDQISWGAQFSGTIRLGENDNDYSLGDKFETTHWVAYEFADWVSGSVRGLYSSLGNIDGADPQLNPMMVPTADPDRRGGERYDLGLGINLYAPSGALKGVRVAVEALLPLYQDLDGPQLETDVTWVAGVQGSF